MVLFIGCRHPDRDAMYAAELAQYAELGILTVKYAFSSAPEMSEGCRYVQERVWREKSKSAGVVDLLMKGKEGDGHGKGRMFVCGSRKMTEGVERVVVEACAEERGWGFGEAEKWVRKVRSEGRFVVEAFD